MVKGRVEAFSDGVVAIIITIMVLELKVPHGVALADLKPVLPVFLGYILSFIYIGIYWNNHHHLFHATERVNAAIMWGNLHLLFWLSLLPFVTAWAGETHGAPFPTACYGVVLFASGLAYYALVRAIVSHHGANSAVARAVGTDVKGRVSLVMYAAAVPLSLFEYTGIAHLLYAAVALMWLVPDRRIERELHGTGAS